VRNYWAAAVKEDSKVAGGGPAGPFAAGCVVRTHA